MLTKVKIKNFKSIRDLEFLPKRVNVFIGEPNTGKTNVLEALALLSEGVHGPSEFREVFRFRNMADLFTDQQVASPVSIDTSAGNCVLAFIGPQFEFTAVRMLPGERAQPQKYYIEPSGNTNAWINLQYGIKYYRFQSARRAAIQQFGGLTPPFGDNLFSIIYTDKDLRGWVRDLFHTRNLKLEIRPVEMELRIGKAIGEESFSFPYESASETWRRIVFYMAALKTNQNSTILFDEPEANTFPFYTKYLAERMALDNGNQFFITTHNPYLLAALVEKTPMKDIAVYVSSMEEYETKLKPVTNEKLSELLSLDADAFFNLDKLVKE